MGKILFIHKAALAGSTSQIRIVPRGSSLGNSSNNLRDSFQRWPGVVGDTLLLRKGPCGKDRCVSLAPVSIRWALATNSDVFGRQLRQAI